MNKTSYAIYTVVDKEDDLRDFLRTNGIVILNYRSTTNGYFSVNSLLSEEEVILIKLSQFKLFTTSPLRLMR